MPLLQLHLRHQLTEMFAKQMQSPVVLQFFTQKPSPLATPVQGCQTCHEAGELLKEVAGLSDKLPLEVHDLVAEAEQARHWGVEKIPGLVIQGKNKGGVRYFGVPAGYEFGVLSKGWLMLRAAQHILRLPRATAGRTRESGSSSGTCDADLPVLSSGSQVGSPNGYRKPASRCRRD